MRKLFLDKCVLSLPIRAQVNLFYASILITKKNYINLVYFSEVFPREKVEDWG